MLTLIVSDESCVCAACLDPIPFGVEHVRDDDTGDHYHAACYVALKDGAGHAQSPGQARARKRSRACRPVRPLPRVRPNFCQRRMA